MDESAQPSTRARRLTVRGKAKRRSGPLDRVLVVVSYATPEMDYFSPQTRPFLEGLVEQYHAAGVPLNGLYADEMHIQQDWGYASHHDEGQLTFRYLTPTHGGPVRRALRAGVRGLREVPGLFRLWPARVPADAGGARAGATCAGRQRGRHPQDLPAPAALLRPAGGNVVDLFAGAKEFAEKTYGHELEARAHATWAESPTCDFWQTGGLPEAAAAIRIHPGFPVVQHRAPGRLGLRRLFRLE